METAAISPMPAGAPRLAPWFGLALLALWLGWLVPAFHALLARTGTPEDAAGIVARLQAASPMARDLTGPAIFLTTPAGCPCQRDAPAPGLRDALRRAGAGTGLHILAAGSDVGYPVVVLAPPARLVYAGPGLVDTGCGAPVPLATLLPALLSTSRQALIVASTCPCPKES